MKTGIILFTIISATGYNQAAGATAAASQNDQAAVTACHSAEATVVSDVKVKTTLYSVKAMAQSGSAMFQYPKKLDNAANGPASAQNKFFVTVLEEGVADPTWSKKGNTYSHTCPDGTKTFTYNAKIGVFE